MATDDPRSESSEPDSSAPDTPPLPPPGPRDTVQQPPADPWAEDTAVRQPPGSVPPSFPDAIPGTEINPPPPAPPPNVGPGGTGILPAVEDGDPQPRWSARAQVRTPNADQPDDDGHQEWAEPGRNPMVPVLVAVVVILLLGLVVLAAFLLINGRDTPTDNPTTPAITVSTAQTSATPSRTSSAPPTSSAPTPVGIPDVKGLEYAAAAEKLSGAGFVPNRVDEISNQVAAGKVIGTNPPANSKLLPGTRVDVIVSKGPPAPTTTNPPPTTSPPASNPPE